MATAGMTIEPEQADEERLDRLATDDRLRHADLSAGESREQQAGDDRRQARPDPEQEERGNQDRPGGDQQCPQVGDLAQDGRVAHLVDR